MVQIRLRDNQTGEVKEVSPEVAQQLLPTGQYGVERGQYNITQDGRTGAIDSSKLFTALREGWQLETPEQARERTVQEKYGDRTITAGAAGAARGLSFGLSDQLMTRALGVRKETLAGLKEANPAASFGSELGAVALSIIGTGGLGAGGQVAGRGAVAGAGAAARVGAGARAAQVAKGAVSGPGLLAGASAGVGKSASERLIGQAAGESLRREVARKATRLGVEGALEGAAYSVGNLISEEALGNAELSAENVIASMGLGAVLGAGVGGALGTGGALFSRGASKTGALAHGVRDSLKETVGKKPKFLGRDWWVSQAEESAVKATGARGSDIRKLQTQEKIQRVGRDLLDYTDEAGNKLMRPGMRADDLAAKLPKEVDAVGKKLSAIRDKVDGYIAANTKRAATAADGKLLKKKSVSELMDMATAPTDDLTPDVMGMFRRVYDDVIAPLRNSDTPGVSSMAKRVEKQFEPLLKRYLKGETVDLARLTKFRQDLDKIIYPKPSGGGIAVAPKAAEQLKQARGVVEDFIEEHTERVLRTMGEDITQYTDTKRVFSSLITARDLAKKASLQDLGNRAISLTDTIAGAGAGGAMGVMSGGTAGVAGAAAGVGFNKVMRERSMSTVAAVVDNLTKRMSVAKTNASVAEQLTQATRKALQKGPTKASGPRGSATAAGLIKGAVTSENFHQVQKALAAYASVDSVSERVGVSLADASTALPKTTNALSAKAVTATQFLHSKLPRPPGDGSTLTPLVSNWKPSKAEVAKFNRYLKAVENPMSVIEGLADGRISRESVEALREVYPRLYEATRMEIARQAAELKERLPYATNVKLSLFFDVPLDPSMKPEAMRRTQMGADPEQAQGAMTGTGQGAGGMRLTGIDKMNLSKQHETETGRLATSL
jgi:hypothetical protein